MRYVIKSPEGGFFSGFDCIETRPVTLRGVLMGHEDHMRPAFKAFSTRDAVKFNDEADALGQIKNGEPLHGGAEVFNGCVVLPTED
jgi:hypothetical protein